MIAATSAPTINRVILRLVALVPGFPGADKGLRVWSLAHTHTVGHHKSSGVAAVQVACKSSNSDMKDQPYQNQERCGMTMLASTPAASRHM
jgi:hypothetical protein